MTAETQVNSQTLPVGYVIEDYRITAVLGQGGFGITYKAADETLQRDVAIKEYMPQQFAYRDGNSQVRPRSEGDRELFEWGLTRFVDEGRALARFRHPNISSVIRYIEHNGTAFLVMEFEEGMDLEHWLKARDRPSEERLVKGILVPVLQGLALVHDKGLLHRDIKPDNIFIRRDGTPVLIDFGASRPHGPEAASRLTSIISAGYSPFEQYGSGERQGPWSDLYALAGTMYRAIAGAPPTDAIARQQGSALVPAVQAGAGSYSRTLLETLDRAMSLDIAARPQDAREFLRLLGVEAPAADPDATQVRLAPPPQVRRRSRRGLVAAALVVAVAAGGAYWAWDAGLLAGAAGPDLATTDVPATGSGTPATGAGDAVDRPEAGAGTRPAAEAEEAAQEAADTDVAAQKGPPESVAEAEVAPPDPADAAVDLLSEDRILAGLDMSGALRAWRQDNLRGAMLSYTALKKQFDDCLKSGCAQQTSLFQRLQEAVEPQTFENGEAELTIAIEEPRRLPNNEDCPFMLNVRETISLGGASREQVRTYCTSDGVDRQVEDAGDVT